MGRRQSWVGDRNGDSSYAGSIRQVVALVYDHFSTLISVALSLSLTISAPISLGESPTSSAMNLLLKYSSPSAAFSARKDFNRCSVEGSSSPEGGIVALICVTSILSWTGESI